MFGYRLLKFATFFIYWLGFAPWVVLLLRKEELLSATNLQDIFLQYTTLLFVLILIYLIIHQVFEYYYVRHNIKKMVRKVTIRHQLERLERGEIDLVAAQRISTFTKLKVPPPTPRPKKRVKSVGRGGEGKRKGEAEKKAHKNEMKESAKVSEKAEIKELPTELETEKSDEIAENKKTDGKVQNLDSELVVEEKKNTNANSLIK